MNTYQVPCECSVLPIDGRKDRPPEDRFIPLSPPTTGKARAEPLVRGHRRRVGAKL